MYGSYSYEQVVQAIWGGFSNDPDAQVVDPQTIYNAAQDFAEAATALSNAGKTIVSQMSQLMGTTGEPLWTGDAADEFAAIVYGILTWLVSTVKLIGQEYNALMGASGQQLYQAQLALGALTNNAVNSYTSAHAPKYTRAQK
ncbi:hypothetical protein GXW83_21820 [Streptacidiphilus sp. PB12-B1b]|uniref:hypothetical protein n=1 Tax=Streptacidiphilus sp. PB12-B1b TaxID=2705012 RepID=UPI0015FCFAC7|nr:hypothetical protein [Streptacidiphilus sp. PB12-B1b]QMU77939.1 hypothetical protein GXW83_21820 [Streptacidiphilus sp. PB12-B1b]